MTGGGICVPAIHSDVPLVLKTGEALTPRNMAAFSLGAHTHGMALPKGTFTNPKNSIESQLSKFVRQHCGEHDQLKLRLQIEFDENKVRAGVCATSGVRTFQMKSTITMLNGVMDGLGWFVLDVVRRASSHHYPIYQLSDAWDFAEMMWFNGATNDREFAAEIEAMNGLDPGSSPEELAESYGGLWPSDLVAAVDGEAWMLGISHFDRQSKTMVAEKPQHKKVLSEKTVARLLKAGVIPESCRGIVGDAINLLDHIKECGVRLEKGHNAVSERNEFDDVYAEGANSFGASCILVWDDPTVFHEAIEHFETSEMESGDATDLHYVFEADPQVEKDLTDFINSLQDFIQRHALVSKLICNFPCWKGN